MKLFTFLILMFAFAIGLSIGEAAAENRSPASFSCKIDYSGAFGAALLETSAENRQEAIEKLSDQCLDELRASSLSADPEEIVVECANVVVSGC